MFCRQNVESTKNCRKHVESTCFRVDFFPEKMSGRNTYFRHENDKKTLISDMKIGLQHLFFRKKKKTEFVEKMSNRHKNDKIDTKRHETTKKKESRFLVFCVDFVSFRHFFRQKRHETKKKKKLSILHFSCRFCVVSTFFRQNRYETKKNCRFCIFRVDFVSFRHFFDKNDTRRHKPTNSNVRQKRESRFSL